LRKVRDLGQSQTIQAVIIYDLDRLARKHGHQLLLLEEFERAEVRLLVASSPIEDSPEGALLLNVKGAMAEYERAKIMERTRRGRVGRARAGHVWGGIVPLGYQYISEPHQGHYVIDEAEAVVVRRVFTMTLAGGTVRGIAMRLTQERIPTAMDRGPRGGGGKKKAGAGVWTQSAVWRMLRNQTYIGKGYLEKRKTVSWKLVPTVDGVKRRLDRRWRSQEEPDAWIAVTVPAIIDEATFQAVQAQLERNKALSFRNGKPSQPYLLRSR
jgi:site-specific DNA recombinase